MGDTDESKSSNNSAALDIFQTFDTDGDGYLTPDELKAIITDPDELAEAMKVLDPENSGKVTFETFAIAFGNELEDEDHDASASLAGAHINLDVVKAKEEENARQFSQVMGDLDDDGDGGDSNKKIHRKVKHLCRTLASKDTPLDVKAINSCFEMVCGVGLNETFTSELKQLFLSSGKIRISSVTVSKCFNDAQKLQKEDNFDTESFIEAFLGDLDKSFISSMNNEQTMEDKLADLTEKNKQLHSKVHRLAKEAEKHKKNATMLDDEVNHLRSIVGEGKEGREEAERLEKERQDQLRSYEDMVDQLQADKQSLENKLKSLRQEHQNDQALLKVKQSMIKNTSIELKELRERMKGLLASHAEHNKLELKKKVGKMTAIIARRKFIRELQVDNERIPLLEVENVRLKETIAQLNEKAKEYLRVMDSYREKNTSGTAIGLPRDNSVNHAVVTGDEEELEELRKQLQEKLSENKKLREDLDDSLNQLEEEKQAKEAAEATILQLTEKVTLLTTQVAELTAAKEELETALQKEKDERAAEKKELEDKIKTMEENIAKLTQELEEEKTARSALQNQLETLGDDSQTKIVNMTQEIADLKKRIKELEAELDEERNQREQVEEKLSKVSAELEIEQEQRARLEEELTETSKKLEEALSKLSELEALLEKKETEVVTIIEAKVFVEAKAPSPVQLDLKLDPDQQAELSAYVRCINKSLKDDEELKYLYPINEHNPELLYKIKDGMLLAKFINLCVPDTIDERALNKPSNGRMESEHILENLTLVIGSAKSIGIPVPDEQKLEEQLLSPSDPDTLLQFLYGLIRTKYFQKVSVAKRPALLDICENPSTGLSGLTLKSVEEEQLEAFPPEQLLLRWVNWIRIAEADGPLEGLCKDWGEDLCDATAFAAILGKIAQVTGDADAMPEVAKTDGKRARNVIDKATYLKVDHFHLPNNITGGNKRLNLLLAACLLNTHTAISDEDEFDEATSGSAKRDPTGKSGDGLTDEMREERQYRMWINSCGIPDCYINNLFLDCRDGLKLLKLIDYLYPGSVDWRRVEKKPKGKFKRVNNCNLIVKYCKKPLNLKIKLIAGTDIAEGNTKLIMAIVGQLMRYDTINKLQKAFQKMGLSGNGNEEMAIVNWANGLVKNNKHKLNPLEKIKKFDDKRLSTSLFFFNLLWAIRPKLIKWKMVNPEPKDSKDKSRNAGYCISIARKLGAEVYILPHDIVDTKKNAIMLFMASLMAVAHE